MLINNYLENHSPINKYLIMIRKSIAIILLFINCYIFSETYDFNIYIDADFTGAVESSLSIKKGIEVALKYYLPENININIITMDHRGNSRRSLGHLKSVTMDEKGLLVYSGLHSPPVLNNLEYINDNSILLLDPWAAATNITRTPDKSGRNWVFRLSVDDSQAGEVIVSYSLDKEKYKRPILLLEETGWGRANEITLKEAIVSRGYPEPNVLWFNWKVGEIGIKQIASDIISHNIDVVFLVANSNEGSKIIKEIAGLNKGIAIRSHWGITGGNTFEIIQEHITRSKVDLKFIQTSFLFTNSELNQYQRVVWERVKSLYPEIREYGDLKAPVGFIHAYDLTKILIQGLKDIDLSNNIIIVRNDLRDSLERLNRPIEGLIKVYEKPFTGDSSTNFFAHEALGIKDFRMAEYNHTGGIGIVE